MSRLVLLSVLALVLAAPAVFAQQDPGPQLPPAPQTPAPQTPSQPKIFRSSASMVALNVTVLDGNKPVGGLERADFEVYEDGVQQTLRFFESRAVPLDVILLLDTSSSMRDKMEVVHDAARGFMTMLRPEDRGAVVSFSDSVKVVQPLTADPSLIEAAIGATNARGATSLYNALYVALKEFGRAVGDTGEVRRQAIAVLSDGEDTASLLSFDDVMKLARKMGVGVYTIALQSELTARGRQRQFSDAEYAMRTLARETGAQSFFPRTVHDLKGVYDAITDELTSQYSIGYSPTNARADGRFRRIIVRVATNPHYRPRTRTGYTAEFPNRAASLGANRDRR
jgi:Ca-activated chloride channel family protein